MNMYDKYINRIKIDYPEDDKLMIDLKQFKNEAFKKQKEAYIECFEKFIPIDKWDEATEFLSTYGSDLAKAIANKEK